MSSTPVQRINDLAERDEEPDTKSVLRSVLMALNETRDGTFREKCFDVMEVDNAEDFVCKLRQRMNCFMEDRDNESTARLDISALLMSARATRFVGGFSICQQRHYENIDSYVCVCSADSCDTIEPLGELDKDNAVVYSTGIKSDRLNRSTVPLTSISTEDVRVRIFPTKRFQTIFGFGGALTDSSMIVLNETIGLNVKLGNQLIRQYYGNDGLDYNLGRIPLASADFSTHIYSYLELENDWELKSFNFTEIDHYKVCIWTSPQYLFFRLLFLRRIINETDGKLRLFSSPWSAPAWIKDSNSMLSGKLKSLYKYKQLYARYFLREFVQVFLGPTLRANWLTKDIKIMAHDDARSGIEDAARKIYSNEHSFIDGLGVHWYSQSSFDVLNNTHYLQPNKFILAKSAKLRCWMGKKSQHYVSVEKLQVDWNIWLDTFGGPNWIGNFVDSPIIVNSTGEFYKQPMYYVLGHFSKFIQRDSQRIQIKIDGYEGKENDNLEAVGFVTPDSNYVVVLHNRDGGKSFDLVVGVDGQTEKFAKVHMPPKTIKTVIWKS
ncbi:Glucosylceramidase [Aphelenchoides besseyi]|nr:Glucosylceramidase [Aphelenchoides besseyi]